MSNVTEVILVEAVLVLNADLGPLHRVSLHHAIRMLCREVAVVHEAEPDLRLGIFPLRVEPGAPSWAMVGPR